MVEEPRQEARPLPQVLKVLSSHMTTLNKHCGSNVSPAQLAGLLRGACTSAELQQVALYLQDQREGAIEINDHP